MTNTVPAEAEQWGGRLPLLSPDELNPDQQIMYRQLLAGNVAWAGRSGFIAQTDDGRLIGPFNGLLYRPDLGQAYNAWGTAEQQGNSYSERVRQVVILTVGVEWSSDYEIYAHVAVARTAGLSDAVISAIRAGGPVDGLNPDETAARNLAHQIVTTKTVDDATYATAVEVLGNEGVVQLAHLIGQYLTTSVLLNTFAVPAPKIP